MTPEGWRRLPLRAVLAAVATGVSVNSASRPRVSGEVGVLKTSAVTSGTFRPSENKAVLPSELARARQHPLAGAVLVSRMNTVHLVGASAFVERDWPDLVLPDRIWQLRPDEESADGRWLHQLLSAPETRARLSELASGTSGSMKNLSQEKFLGLELAVPPLAEQKRIGVILSAADHAIESAMAVIEQLERLKNALMEQLLTGGIPGRHARFRRSAFGDVPESWSQQSLSAVVDQVRQGVDVDRAATYREIGVRSHGRGVFHKEPVLGLALGEKRVFWVEPGCLVLNIVFAWEGAVASTHADDQGLIASHRFPMLRPKEGLVELEYLRLLLQTRAGTRLLSGYSPGGAGRNRTLNLGALLSTPIHVPPMSEQRAIVGTITETERRLVAERQALDGLQFMKRALMAALISGEVRVNVRGQMQKTAYAYA